MGCWFSSPRNAPNGEALRAVLSAMGRPVTHLLIQWDGVVMDMHMEYILKHFLRLLLLEVSFITLLFTTHLRTLCPVLRHYGLCRSQPIDVLKTIHTCIYFKFDIFDGWVIDSHGWKTFASVCVYMSCWYLTLVNVSQSGITSFVMWMI